MKCQTEISIMKSKHPPTRTTEGTHPVADGERALAVKAVARRPIPRLPRIALGALGVAAGFCNGLLGAAGGVLLVLLLPYLLGSVFPTEDVLSRRDLLATSLTVMLPVSAVSAAIYWLGGIRPSGETAVLLLLPSVLGGLIGARLLGKLPEQVLRRLFALLLVISGVRMLF